MNKKSHDQDMQDRMCETVERHAMLEGVRKALIGFSSGPDSVCLLDMLVQRYGGNVELIIVYVNHGLRPRRILGKEEDLTRIYAEKYGIKCKIIRVNVRQGKSGPEAQAREERHQALIRYMRKVKAQRILLGHNLDDVIETFFINLLRGSGTRGMRSIPPLRPPFARPLISLKKTDIIRYNKDRGLRYSIDETNQDPRFRRNLLRMKMIPYLARLNPNFQEMMGKSIEILRADDECLQECAERAYRKVVTRRKKHLVLDLTRLMRYNKSIVNRVVFAVIKNLVGSATGFESKHVDSILSLKGKSSGKIIHLPKHLYVQKIYDKVFLGKVPASRLLRMQIGLKGCLRIARNMVLRTSVVNRFDPGGKQQCEFFDLRAITPPLYVRSRNEGDYILTKSGRKKLKKLLNEKKVPAVERDRVVLLCDQKGIIWVPGVGRAYRGFIDRGAKRILKVEFEYID